jgi:2-dehydropantoate 2-reductase
MASPGPRFLVVGAGGIGGVVAAHLTEQGHDVTTLTRNPLIADAINAYGFRVRGEGNPGTVRGEAVRKLPARAGKFDYVLLATQPPQVEEAAKSVVDALDPSGRVVCFQNGLCEERIAKLVGAEKVIGAVVAWGASMVEPGVYDRTSAGGFQLGTLDGPTDERVAQLARALEAIGPTVTTQNLRGARWSKLAINCAISSLGTIGGDRLGVLMRHRFVRRLALEIMTEVTEVARARGVRLEKVSGTLDLDWIALTEEEKKSAGSAALVAKHALLLAVGARYRRLRSSMLSAIERGRQPAVEFLNGEVVLHGDDTGVATTINTAVRDQVLAIAAGKAKSSVATLRALFDATRGGAGAGPTTVAPASAPPASAPSASEPPAASAPSASEPPAASASEEPASTDGADASDDAKPADAD